MDRILILLDHKENRRLLTEWLKGRYDVVAAAGDPGKLREALAHEAYDLCIVDGVTMDRYGDAIRAAKAAQSPTYLPFLLITSRQDVSVITRHLWRTVDELILAPIERVELSARVEILLRARRFSRESEERYYTLAANSPVGVVIEQDDHVVYANRAFLQLSGLSAVEASSGPLHEWIDAEDREQVRHYAPVREPDFPPQPIEVRLAREMPVVWVELHKAPLTFHGRPATLYLVSDVSVRKAAEQELREAKRQAEEMADLKSALLTNMSHEIRTPLTGILGFAEILASESPESLQPLAQLIERSGQRLLHTLNSVLNLAQLESRTLTLEPTACDVCAQVREDVDFFRRQAGEHNLELTFECDAAEPIRATIDRTALHRVLNNLISNALKFTPQGSVRVTLEADDDSFAVKVRDTGVGIDPSFLPQIFDDFKQESTGMSRNFEGCGLGLSITKRLVDLMGGRIEVESEKGVGSSFTVRLPCVPREPDAATRHRPESQRMQAAR